MVNITEFEAPECPPLFIDILGGIWERQRALMTKYKEIEQLPDPPVSLHHAHGQRILKDFAWRTHEELTESFEAWLKHEDSNVAEMHALEELADATHFLVELCIFAGISATQCAAYSGVMPVPKTGMSMSARYWWTTYKLGLAMNFLRNKAWKVSQVPTDEPRFRQALLETFHGLLMLWTGLGYTQETMWDYYTRKHQVNGFRQRSKY